MAKVSAVEKDKRRRRSVANAAEKRAALKKIIMDKSSSMEERFRAQLKLAQMPRNAAGEDLTGLKGDVLHGGRLNNP